MTTKPKPECLFAVRDVLPLVEFVEGYLEKGREDVQIALVHDGVFGVYLGVKTNPWVPSAHVAYAIGMSYRDEGYREAGIAAMGHRSFVTRIHVADIREAIGDSAAETIGVAYDDEAFSFYVYPKTSHEQTAAPLFG